jgi:ATP-dependent helicase Lhr and Lhr-like helicase
VRQAVHDCLHEAMDIDGLEALLRDLEAGRIEVVACDVASPSQLAQEILTARPYAFLDDAPLEERRTQAVMGRRWLDEASATTLGRLDVAAIERVRDEAWPAAGNVDEMHDALLGLGFVTLGEAAARDDARQHLDALARQGRATCLSLRRPDSVPGDTPPRIWVAAERLPQFQAVFGPVDASPAIVVPQEFARRSWTREAAIVEIVRSRLEGLGPVTRDALANSLCVPSADVDNALAVLAGQGVAMAGSFTSSAAGQEWCDRALLARIHRYTVQRLRQEIEPVGTQDFMRFLFRWQHLLPNDRRAGPDALDAVIGQLQGFEAPVAAWESELLPARLDDYDMTWLDDLCLSGRAVWARLTLPAANAAASRTTLVRTAPVTLLPRRAASAWKRLAAIPQSGSGVPSARTQPVADYLRQHGASFFDEIVDGTRLLRTQVEEALAELVALGLVHCDSFAGLRALLTPSGRRKAFGRGRQHRRALSGIEDAGRWTLRTRATVADAPPDGRGDAELDTQDVEHVVHALLRRYGVVFWRMLEREAAWLPPWREMLRILRRLEARGDIRGGRFVASVSGEQFALPDAVRLLRETRRAPAFTEFIVLSGADPLNLAGILLPGARIPALTSNRLLFRDGLPIASLVGGQITWHQPIAPAETATAEALLVRQRPGTPRLAMAR